MFLINWQIGSKSTKTTPHPNSSSDSCNQQVKSKCEVEKDATLSLLTSFQQETKSDDDDEKKTGDDRYSNVEASEAAEPMWLSSNAVGPDLQLTLAAPKVNTLEQPKSSPGSFLLGSISVT